MNKILAVFRKEYVETRTTTLVFWLFGVLFPLLKVFDVSVGTYADANPILLGGALAAWLNAAFLTASTFAREKEDGTFQTLRRVVPDWRVAVAGKGAWIIASTLILVAFFGAELFVAAKIDGESFLKGFRDILNANSNKGDEGTLTTALVVSITSVCWGVFWTARSSRQMSAIFLSILSPLVANIVVAVFVASVNLIGSATDKSTLGATAWIVAILGLFALVAAPFPTRFGYRESEKKHAAAGKPDRRDASWNRIDVRKKGGSFPTLVSLAFADASLLVRSPVSALFELSILFFIVACAFAFEPFGLDASELSAALFVFYYSCFASGLFSDSKRKSSLVRERLGVKPRAYWLANAFAALLMGAAVCGALVAIDRLGGWVDHSLFADDFKFAALSFLLFGILLWSASLKGSRLVVWSVSVVVFSAAFFGADRELGLLDSTVLERFGEPFNDWAVAIAGAFGALVFVVASRRIVTRRADYRKAPWSVAIPIVLTVACVVFANAPRPAKLPKALELREIAEASFPQSQTEYEKLVADARESVAPVASAPLFKTTDGSDAEAIELNDLREKFLDACELTNRRAATFVDVENAEKAFYAALRKALDNPNRRFPEPTELNAELQFLVEIPSIRPTAER
ncbi:MAG: hypothetical protein J6X44_10245, partial [Thermoguttaceae bacterium]|nr:hypothetical protein [Thermoguttaceae bacterium]